MRSSMLWCVATRSPGWQLDAKAFRKFRRPGRDFSPRQIPDVSGIACLNTIVSASGSAEPNVSVVIPVYNSEQILPD